MNGLRLFFFAEFAAVALAAPAIGLFRERITRKLWIVCAPLLLGLIPLLIAVHVVVPAQSLRVVLYLQVVVIAFAVAVAGVAALAGRRWPCGGPAVVTIVAMLVLATPFWGDALVGLDHDGVRRAAQRSLVAPNPLFSAAKVLDNFDWTHDNVLYARYNGYKLTRIGEDFPYVPTRLWVLAFWYLLAGLLAAGLAGLVRPVGGASGMPSMGAERFC